MTKTIKVIDLLNKIANDFSYQPTVIYRGITYKHDGTDYRNNQNDKYGILAGWAINLILNDTVEILEEQQDIDYWEEIANTFRKYGEALAEEFAKIGRQIDKKYKR